MTTQANDALGRLFREWRAGALAEVAAYLQAHPSAKPATVARNCAACLGRPEVAGWLMDLETKIEGR